MWVGRACAAAAAGDPFSFLGRRRSFTCTCPSLPQRTPPFSDGGANWVIRPQGKQGEFRSPAVNITRGRAARVRTGGTSAGCAGMHRELDEA